MTGTAELLDAARSLLTAAPAPSGWQARAVATLTRQALEAALDDFWLRVAPGVEAAPRSTQLLCLPTYAGDQVAGLASTTWSSLSNACHVRAYDLAPSLDELARWLAATAQVLDALQER